MTDLTVHAEVGDGGRLVGKIDAGPVEITVYWHIPSEKVDGDTDAPYVVIDIDSAEEEPPVRVYVNDGPVAGAGVHWPRKQDPCVAAGEHQKGADHRWQECPTYHDDEESGDDLDECGCYTQSSDPRVDPRCKVHRQPTGDDEPAEEGVEVVDLVAALRGSVEAAKKRREAKS